MMACGLMGLASTLTTLGLFAGPTTNVFVNPAGGLWSEASNWEGGSVGGGAGTVTKLSAALTGDAAVTLDAGATNAVGSLVVENSGTAGRRWIVTGAGAAVKFDGDGTESSVFVGSGAALRTGDMVLANDVVKTGPGLWELAPSSTAAFRSRSVVVVDGTNAFQNGNYAGSRLVLKAENGSSPALRFPSAELKSGGPTIAVPAGEGSPALIYETYGKVYGAKLVLERMVEVNVPVNHSGTLFGDGVTGTGGIRKTGIGTLAFGAAPSFAGDIILSEGSISGASSWWDNNAELAVTIGDESSDPAKGLGWGFSEKGDLPGAKTRFHVTRHGGPVTFYWSKSQNGATARCPFVLDRSVTFNANVSAGSANTFAGVISGAGGIVFTGGGTDRGLVLAAPNVYRGATAIDKVTVRVGCESAFGTGDVSVGARGRIQYVAAVPSAIADTATLTLESDGASHALVDFGANAVVEKVGRLVIDGERRSGVWGAMDSDAENRTEMILGAGRIAAGGPGLVISAR